MTGRYTYEQRTGRFLKPDGTLLATGYSGIAKGLNNPAMEDVRGVGPIPAGDWSIDLHPVPPEHVGPFALALLPVGHNAHGRSLFRIHGDNVLGNHTASHGCIILGRPARQAIIAAGVTALRVVSG